MLGIEPVAAGFGSKYVNHCSLLPPPPSPPSQQMFFHLFFNLAASEVQRQPGDSDTLQHSKIEIKSGSEGSEESTGIFPSPFNSLKKKKLIKLLGFEKPLGFLRLTLPSLTFKSILNWLKRNSESSFT